MNLSNITFYKRHNLELERYLHSESSIHIINKISKNKIKEDISKKVYIDMNNTNQNIDIGTDKYETIILTDILESSNDIYEIISILKKSLKKNGKLIVTSVNTKYFTISKILDKLNLKDKNYIYSDTNNKKIKSIASGLGFEIVSTTSKQIFPFRLLGIGNFINKLLELFLFRFSFGIKTYSVYRLISQENLSLSKTIIIPAKNEEGNLNELINRIPKFKNCQIIICCGVSKDKTYELAKEIATLNKDFRFKVLMQTGQGKANAVWDSLKVSSGDVIAILDADISVDPEELEHFFDIIEKNNADFVNGTRLIYEMEKGSMRFINKLGNRLFQFLISQVIKTNLTDSLCGTKVFKKNLINKIFWWQETFQLNDPFGDFDLLFTASYTGQKIIEYPIHYKARKYGKTQISRFRDGYKLIKYFFKSFIVFNASRI